jgi:hypothetical protein
MALGKRRTAKQIAASKRNIIAAQRASAASRRGKKRSTKAGHHYGTGKTGRRQARINKYGSRKHGISIAQQTRRDKRSRKYKKAGATAVAGGVFAVKAAMIYRQNPEVKKSVDTAAKRAKSTKRMYKTSRMVGRTRKQSAGAAYRWAKG